MKKITSYITGTFLVLYIIVGISNYLSGTFSRDRFIGFLIIILGAFVFWILNKYIAETKFGTSYRILFFITLLAFLSSYIFSQSLGNTVMYENIGYIWFTTVKISFGLTLVSGIIALIKKN